MPDTATPAAEAARGQIAYDASSALAMSASAQRELTNATDFVVDSNDMLEVAGDDLRRVKSLQKAVEDQRTSITGPLNQAVKAVNDLFRGPAQYLLQAEQKLKGAMLTYQQEQQRLADEARRKAEAEARAEREKQAAIQREQEAKAREAAAAAERAEREAAAARAAGDAAAAEKAQAEARQQAEAAQTAAIEAQAAEQTAAVLTMPAVVPEPARVAGISTSKTVDFEVVDLHALVRHIAEHPELVGLLVPDTVRLRAQVKATGLRTALPGVRVFQKETMAARRAA